MTLDSPGPYFEPWSDPAASLTTWDLFCKELRAGLACTYVKSDLTLHSSAAITLYSINTHFNASITDS